MLLRPQPIASVPEDTSRVAWAAFPHGTPALPCRDALGTIFQDPDGAALLPLEGQPGLPPGRVALVTILQCRDKLADRQAAEAVRARMAWTYLRGLEVTDPGVDVAGFSACRARWLDGRAAARWRDARAGGPPGAQPPGARPLKGRSHRTCAPVGAVVPGLVDWPSPTCNMGRSPPPSLWTGLSPGSTSAHGRSRAPLASRHWRLPASCPWDVARVRRPRTFPALLLGFMDVARASPVWLFSTTHSIRVGHEPWRPLQMSHA